MWNNRSGTILIVTLWILVILTVFALALGERASLEVKLAEYQRDKLRARELAKAAIERLVWEKKNDSDTEIDALNESWANDEASFKDIELGDETFTGTFTASYALGETTLYGMEDEQGKINVNEATQEVLTNLFEDYDDADKVAASIAAWRSPTEEVEEEDYYQNLELPYHCKNAAFKTVGELLLVRHIRENPQLLYGEEGIAQYLTVYGDGKININTASEKVLLALTGDENLVEEIVEYRKGDDGEIGTDDDEYFLNTSFNEWPQLKIFAGHFCVASNIYTIHAQAEVNKAKKSIIAAIDLENTEQIKYLFWQTK